MVNNSTEHRRLVAIMFTDMVGYSALTQRNEALALELLEEHHQILRDTLPSFQGNEIKSTGDGLLVEFSSALAAVHCAVEIQRRLAERNENEPEERHVRIRIGIHLGDVVKRGNDVLGDGVNIAARIEPLAEPGGICVSRAVFEQIENKVRQPCVQLSKPELKNISSDVSVYKLILDAAKADLQTVTRRHRHFYWVIPGVVVLMVVLFLKFGLDRKAAQSAGAVSTNEPAASRTTHPDQISIAVLPFVSMSADKADEYLSDGMTEELLNALAKVPGLRVPGRSSSFAFKGKTEEGIFRRVGEQLHVTTVLEGSVRKAGDKLRITAQLISVADGFHLWSETYDRDMKDILAVQTEVAQQVVQVLQLKLGVEATLALAKSPTENAEAHRLYLLGRYHFAKWSQAGWNNALKYFDQALQLDRNYALAYCGLADTYGWLGFNVMPGREAWGQAKNFAQNALALDPHLADAHLSLGIALASAFDWSGGEGEINRAVELNPNLPLAYDSLAWLQCALGRFDEALRNEHLAIELDPLSPLFNVELACWFYTARRYDEGIAQARKTLELDPNFATAHAFYGTCLLQKRDFAGAIAAYQKGKSLDPRPHFDAALGYAYAAAGDRAKAEQILRELEELAKHSYVAPSVRVPIHLGLGEKDKALDWLEKSYEEQDGACWWLKTDPLYDSLRPEPRFQALVKKVFPDP
jgi:adenylate cyclase